MKKTSVDLGCGRSRRNPFQADICLGVDVFASDEPDYFRCRLGIDLLPFSEASVDFFSAYDVIEHIPRVLWRDGELINPFISLMNEIYRCLKPSGIFYAETPAFPHAPAFQDPTHVNIITEQTVYYFCEKHPAPPGESPSLLLRHGQNYGFSGEFTLRVQSWKGIHLVWELEKNA
ncbi:MAG: methyltransferase domain-containing protein [Synechococcus sp. ELA057]